MFLHTKMEHVAQMRTASRVSIYLAFVALKKPQPKRSLEHHFNFCSQPDSRSS